MNTPVKYAPNFRNADLAAAFQTMHSHTSSIAQQVADKTRSAFSRCGSVNDIMDSFSPLKFERSQTSCGNIFKAPG
jgi:hypothetical protein